MCYKAITVRLPSWLHGKKPENNYDYTEVVIV